MSRRLLFRNQGGRGHIAATSMSLLMMSCATTTARDPDDPGWEVDVGQPDAAVVQPSTHSGPIPIDPCNGFYCASYPPGSSCMGAGAYSMCTGTRGACWSASGAPICAGSCVFTPRAVAETCNGQDDDCDNLVDENPSALCDDGLDCSTDICFGTGGCYNSVPGSCQEIRRPTAESRVAPDGTWLMRRDNPRLTGRVFARVASQTGTAGSFTRTMNPVAGAIIGNGFANIEPGNPAAGWLYSENVAGAAAGFSTFRAPQVLLNVTGTTDIALYRFPAASGAAFEQVDFVRMQMAPEVLVLPVRVTVFGSTQAAASAFEKSFRQVFDPGAVETLSYNIVGGSPNVVTAVSREVVQAGPPPDDVWTQCDIQFRLEEFIPVANAAVATRLTDTCDCSGVFNDGIWRTNNPLPVRPYLFSAPTNRINVFVGGTIGTFPGESGTCPNGNDIAGYTCGSVSVNGGCGWNGEPTGDATMPVRNAQPISYRTLGADFILIDRALPGHMGDMGGTLAHELGHFLGLAHTNDGYEQCLDPRITGHTAAGDTAGYPANSLLMNTGGGIPMRTVTPQQCRRARCMAARWIELTAPSSGATTRRVMLCES